MWTRLRVRCVQLIIGVTFAALAGCPAQPEPFVLESSVFLENTEIPERYAGPSMNGEPISPPLFWSEPPAGTQELALIVTDEAGRTRWILYGIEPDITILPEAIPQGPLVGYPPGARQGIDWNGLTGYQGGIQRDEETMVLQFVLYALDTSLDFESNVTLDAINDAMQGHIIGSTALAGRFSTHDGLPDGTQIP